MKSSILAVAAAAGLVAAQNLSGEPACAIPCITSAATQVGCALTDQACQCASQAAIGSAAVACLLGACQQNDLLTAQSVGSQLCASFSATATATATGSSSGSDSASATGSGSSSSGGPTTSGGGPSATGSAAGNSSITSSASQSTRPSVTTTTSSRTSASSASAASSSSTAGAEVVQAGTFAGAGVLGLVLAAAAVL